MDTINVVIRPQAADLSATKRELLKKRLSGVLKPMLQNAGIPRRNLDEPAPLSFAQERLWKIYQRQPGNYAYHLPCALRLNGELNVPALEYALNALIERHEILRTTFRPGAQLIQPAEPIPLPVVDLQEYAPRAREAHLQQLLYREARRPFNLETGPLIRNVLFRLGERDYVLLSVMHQISSDGWSLGVFFKELEQLYHAFATDLAPDLPPLPVQYSDFAAWQREQLFESDAAFWKEKLASARIVIDLPIDHPRPARAASRGAHFTLSFPETFYESILDLNRDLGITAFMLLMTSLSIVLFKWCRQPELVLGTAVACRTRREIENLIGCFMNFLPIRAEVTDEQTGLELLKQIKGTILEAHSHQECPFEKIIDSARSFNVALLLQNFPPGVLSADGITSTFLPLYTDTCLLDLRFVAEQKDKQLSLTCEYDVALFDPATIHYLMHSYRAVLLKLVQAPQTPIDEFTIADQLRDQTFART